MPRQMNKDTISDLKGEELNLSILERFLRENIDDLPAGPIEILQFSAWSFQFNLSN